MEADAILRQAAQRMVQRFDLGHGELAIVLGRRLRIDLVEILGDRPDRRSAAPGPPR
jgi:hypothetical protein